MTPAELLRLEAGLGLPAIPPAAPASRARGGDAPANPDPLGLLAYHEELANQPAKVKVDKPGTLAYLAAQAKAGLTADLPAIAGKALQYTGDPGDALYDIGTDWRAAGDANAAQAQPDAERGPVTRFAASALRGAAPIVPLAVGGLLAQATPLAPAIDIGGAAALAGAFGAGQGQDTLEKGRAAGLPEEQARDTARKTAAVTGVGMGALGMLTGGVAAPALRALAGDAAQAGFVRPFVADTAGHLVGNTAAMAGANAGVAAVEHGAGLDSPTAGEAALEGLESGAGLTAVLTPFGAARTVMAQRAANAQAAKVIRDTQTVPETGVLSAAANAGTEAKAQSVENAPPVAPAPQEPAPVDAIMERIKRMEGQDRIDAAQAYSVVQRDDAPKGVRQFNSKLLDRLLNKQELAEAPKDATPQLEYDPTAGKPTLYAGEEGAASADPNQRVPLLTFEDQPTGVLRADAAGNVAPETRADVIDTNQVQNEAAQEAQRKADLGLTPDVEAAGKTEGDWQKFPENAGSLGVPRAEMPQIKSENHGPLVNFLNARGVAHEITDVEPRSLKPTQDEYSESKAEAATKFEGERSILVSSDDHVIDGHHQWLAAGAQGEPVKAIRLDAPAKELLPLIREFPSAELSGERATEPKPATKGNPHAPEARVQSESPGSPSDASAARGENAAGESRAAQEKPSPKVADGGAGDQGRSGVLSEAAAPVRGKEISRDTGVYRQGMSEARAKQRRTELAKQNPAIAYAVEQDETLKHGYVVVGRKLTVRRATIASDAKAQAAAAQAAAAQPEGAGGAARRRQGGKGDDAQAFRGPEAQRPETLTPLEIQSEVSNLTTHWLRKPDIHVLDSMDDAPARVREIWQQQNSQGGSGAVEGFHHKGGVYLVADAIDGKEDVARVLFHEALGHFGLRNVFGKTLDPILDQLAALRRGEVAVKAKQYGLDLEKPAERRLAAEEVLAEYAQTRPEIGYVRRAIAAIRTWLRENIPGFKDLELSDDEIVRNYIMPARGFVERGRSPEPTQRESTAQASRKPENTEAIALLSDELKRIDETMPEIKAVAPEARVEDGKLIVDQANAVKVRKLLGTPPVFSRASDAIERARDTAAVREASQAWDGLQRVAAPQYRSDAAREVARQLIQGMGEKEMKGIQFRAKLNRAIVENDKNLTAAQKARDLLDKGLTVQADKVFLHQSPEDNYAFMQAMDAGDAKYFEQHPQLKGMADVIGKMFNEKAREVQELDTGAMQTIRESYFPHVWAREPAADKQREIFSTLSKRPLEGDKGFTKARVFEDVKAGIDAGFEPLSTNPLDLVALKMQEMDKYILAHKTLKAMEGSDGVHLIGAGEKTPEGFVDVNGRFGNIERNGEKLRYVARDDVGQVINNYLSASLYHNRYIGKPFTAYMGAANTLNQFQLGVFSAFHAGFTSFEAVISHASIGLKALSKGDLKGAAKYLASAPAAWINNPKMGSKIIEEMLNKGTHPEMAQIIEGLQLAGFKWQMDNRFRTDATKKMLASWAEGKKATAAFHSIGAIAEQSARPILEWLVPRQKFGVFGEMYSAWMHDNPNATHEQLRDSAQQIWNRVDSRLGQVVYDRLFVHNVGKNFAQMLIRAPGWTGGTILEVGGGIKDLAKFAADIASGKKPDGISDRAAYTLSMLMVTAIANAALTAMFTGEAPDDWRDLVAFRSGNLDEHGRPERFMLPTYMKDLYSYAHAPGQTAVNKAHPLLSLVGDVVRNRDFQGTEIRSEDDNLMVQLAETAGFAAQAFVPFWMKGVQKEDEREGSALAKAAPLVGVMPASADFNKSPAEKLMSEYGAEKAPQGARTQAESQKAQLRQKMYLLLRKGETADAMDIYTAGNEQGTLGPRDYLRAVRQSQYEPLINSFQHLTFEQSQRVMRIASDDEREKLQPLFERKQAEHLRDHPETADAE